MKVVLSVSLTVRLTGLSGLHALLTPRLLAFSRQQPLALEVVDINKFVAGMSEMLRRTVGENLHLETVLAGGLWRTYG